MQSTSRHAHPVDQFAHVAGCAMLRARQPVLAGAGDRSRWTGHDNKDCIPGGGCAEKSRMTRPGPHPLIHFRPRPCGDDAALERALRAADWKPRILDDPGDLANLPPRATPGVALLDLRGVDDAFAEELSTQPGLAAADGDQEEVTIDLARREGERAALSFGYDQSIVGRTQQNGEDAPGAVRVVLGTLVLGASYRLGDRTSLNVALGVGVTRDTPDVTLAVRVPVGF